VQEGARCYDRSAPPDRPRGSLDGHHPSRRRCGSESVA
jgi:hypothetical protein